MLQGLPLLDVCDADVQTHCASLVSSTSIGKVRSCLTDVATPALVAAGAPINNKVRPAARGDGHRSKNTREISMFKAPGCRPSCCDRLNQPQCLS